MTTYYIDSSVGNNSNAGTSPGSGNAWATLAKGVSSTTTGDTIYVKAASGYTVSANLTPAAQQTWLGYTSSPGDNGVVSITATSGCTAVFAPTNYGLILANFAIDCASIAAYGVNTTGTETTLCNLKITNFTTTGINVGGSGDRRAVITACEITAANAASTAGIASDDSSCSQVILYCWIHDNPCPGIAFSSGGASLIENLITNNTGGSSDGVIMSYGGRLIRNTIFGNGRDGFRLTNSGYVPGSVLSGNIFDSNGGYGINVTSGTAAVLPGWNYNAFRANTTAPRNNVSAGPNDITLSANPFTASASNDYSLNTTSGGGAALRSAGFPGAFPGGLSTGHGDVGAVQHADPGGGSGMLFIPNGEGT